MNTVTIGDLLIKYDRINLPFMYELLLDEHKHCTISEFRNKVITDLRVHKFPLLVCIDRASESDADQIRLRKKLIEIFFEIWHDNEMYHNVFMSRSNQINFIPYTKTDLLNAAENESEFICTLNKQCQIYEKAKNYVIEPKYKDKLSDYVSIMTIISDNICEDPFKCIDMAIDLLTHNAPDGVCAWHMFHDDLMNISFIQDAADNTAYHVATLDQKFCEIYNK